MSYTGAEVKTGVLFSRKDGNRTVINDTIMRVKNTDTGGESSIFFYYKEGRLMDESLNSIAVYDSQGKVQMGFVSCDGYYVNSDDGFIYNGKHDVEGKHELIIANPSRSPQVFTYKNEKYMAFVKLGKENELNINRIYLCKLSDIAGTLHPIGDKTWSSGGICYCGEGKLLAKDDVTKGLFLIDINTPYEETLVLSDSATNLENPPDKEKGEIHAVGYYKGSKLFLDTNFDLNRVLTETTFEKFITEPVVQFYVQGDVLYYVRRDDSKLIKFVQPV